MAGSLWAASMGLLQLIVSFLTFINSLQSSQEEPNQQQWWLADPDKVQQQTMTKLVFTHINWVA